MTLDEVIADLRRYGVVIVNECELWPQEIMPSSLELAFKKHRAGLHKRLHCGDISLCVDYDYHRKYWYYAGHGQFYCEVCEKLAYIA